MRSCVASPGATWGTNVTAIRSNQPRASTRLYLKLIDTRHVHWQDCAHFFAMSSRVMRRVLVDATRARGYQKRGAGARQVTLDEGRVGAKEPAADVVALDDALTALGIENREFGM